ncbi:M23 family metallopeptidase [Nonomuraea bangladeshensis]|uniref:M23 family metallopeptidase n=1 Tax=Nonomuraea bangladeshensis TaxID=404385 RepID=UPI003C2B50F4
MSFDIELSNPFTSGADELFYGGPGQGGHMGASWPIAFGMDLGAPEGTEALAAFDGKVTSIFRPSSPSGGIYGDQITIRQNPNSPGGIGAFYTHLDTSVSVGSFVSRGDVVGRIIGFGGIPKHLHIALAERVNNVYTGVNLYDHFKATVNTDIILVVRFFQNGNPPQVVDFRSKSQEETERYQAALSSLAESEYSNTWTCAPEPVAVG